jgi:DNA ligase-1
LKIYCGKKDILGWHVAEKYDGVQGVWGGKTLKTRDGWTINAPAWWLEDLPDRHLAGELWIDRDRFDEVRAIVQSENAGEKWRDVKYMIFKGTEDGVKFCKHAFLVEQFKIISQEHFDTFYKDIINNGGEGVVITAPDGTIFKHKPIIDTEGVLIGHTGGKGLNQGKIGAFILRLRDGKIFKLGMGLTENTRINPPKKGSIILFNYRGFTSKGLPRHAVFRGIRAEGTLSF